MKKLVVISILSLSLLPFSLFSQQNEPNGINQELQMIQEQMNQMLQQFGNMDDQSSFFFSDSLNFNDLGDFSQFPLDSMIQGLSFVFPGMESDSMFYEGFGDTNDIFGSDFQNQLEKMFRSFDDLDPSYFQGMEELLKELEQNGIRPDDLEQDPSGKVKKKKKVYKL